MRPTSLRMIIEGEAPARSAVAWSRLAVGAFVDLGEGRQRALKVIGGRKQRLRLVRAFARDKADAAALRAPVEEKDAARRRLAHDFEPGDLIAQVERQVERRRSRSIPQP